MTLSKKDMVDMTRGLYNVDYPLWEKYFVESGGSANMSMHIWGKWKEAHQDNFLWEFGNLDLENERIVTQVLNKLIKHQRLSKEEKIKIGRKAWEETDKRNRMNLARMKIKKVV